MKTDMKKELERIQSAARALEKRLSSKDPKVARNAQARLGQVAERLEAWATKHNVKLRGHKARRRLGVGTTSPGGSGGCPGIVDVVVHGKPYTCILTSSQGGYCQYRCVPALIHVEF